MYMSKKIKIRKNGPKIDGQTGEAEFLWVTIIIQHIHVTEQTLSGTQQLVLGEYNLKCADDATILAVNEAVLQYRLSKLVKLKNIEWKVAVQKANQWEHRGRPIIFENLYCTEKDLGKRNSLLLGYDNNQ